jgi:hypothetical protein
MKRFALICALACTWSCSSDGNNEGTPTNGDCDERTGSYRSTWSERSGTCGAIDESIDTISEQPTEPEPPCTGEISYSANNCRVTASQECPGDSVEPEATIEMDSVADWNASGTRGTAIQEVTVKDSDGVTICHSTYDAVITKL